MKLDRKKATDLTCLLLPLISSQIRWLALKMIFIVVVFAPWTVLVKWIGAIKFVFGYSKAKLFLGFHFQSPLGFLVVGFVFFMFCSDI